MRVICIKEVDERKNHSKLGPSIIKVGNEYNVIEVSQQDGKFVLQEDPKRAYKPTLFAPLSDIDEKEFERNYNFQTV